MPKQYEAIRDKMAAGGMDYDEAQSHAAAIYNSKHPGSPVGRNSDSAAKPKAKKKSGKGLQALVNKSKNSRPGFQEG